ncbi:MAG TPA: presqualene diphosphate synthase HpnD [Solirubrobacteraceae bacterium]|nr:presqualene diphosphate synthase HpnD [Solirubrobacteraceae bacterium]
MSATAEQPYKVCEEITRNHAANFFYGIRLLPAEKRRAMCAAYALARRIDDVGDGEMPDADKLRALTALREQVSALPDAPTGDPVLSAVGDATRRFALPVDAFVDLVDGVHMDVAGTTYDQFDELVSYCRRVAGTIGRLCLAIFDSRQQPEAVALADDLGVAMQLTNILRDVREDLERGRVYLPAEDLRRFGCSPGLDGSPPGALAELIRFEAARAGEWFDRGLGLLPLLDARSASCVATMTGIYRRILERIERDPSAVLRERVSLPAWEKGWVAMRSLAGAVG